MRTLVVGQVHADPANLLVYGSSLLVGVEPEVQRYIEPCYHVTTEAAQEAACQRALNLNVVEFLVWLGAGAVEEDGDSNSGWWYVC